MVRVLSCGVLLFLSVTVLPPSSAVAAGVQPLFDLEDPSASPFPSDRFTVPDDDQLTGRRVHLPKPDCTTRPSDCEDIDVLNELDGFNVQPRLSIPFTGSIDVGTVSSETVFLLPLGGGPRIGINQIVWDTFTHTLHVESNELLEQHTRYVLIVTRDVRDAAGEPVEAAGAFQAFRHGQKVGQRDDDPAVTAYRDALLAGLDAAAAAGVDLNKVAVASVFSTQSITAILEKIRDQIKAATPAPADFRLGPVQPDGSRTRAVFRLDAVTGITFNRQISVAGPLSPVPVPIAALGIFPSPVGQIAFGKFLSPDYERHPGEFIPPVGTRTGMPPVQGTNEIYFNLFLPSGSPPAGGWPVAITGHGSGGSKNFYPFNVAKVMAEHGLATIAINAVGHGLGSLGTLSVTLSTGASVTFNSGGRGIDQNGDGAIGLLEGMDAARPRTILRDRDGLRQTVVDLMQLVRVIEMGMDIDGIGSHFDLDPSRIYYFGFSLGGMFGAPFLAVEPSLVAGVLTVPVALQAVRGAFSPVFRPSRGAWLRERTPSLINSPGLTAIGGIPVGPPRFNENLPLRNQPPVVNDVEGAMAIQEFFENTEWAFMSGDAIAYAPRLRKAPLAGVPSHPILIQFAKGDQNVPNPFTSMMLRAGDLADITTYYRHDLAFAQNFALAKNGHGFMPPLAGLDQQIAIRAQRQIARFFETDGTEIIDPDGPCLPDGSGCLFEVPIILPLPEDFNYIP